MHDQLDHTLIDNEHDAHPPLVIRDVCQSFHGRVVLNHVNMTIKEGMTFGLIGLNGIGKTTLIKIILGLLRPDGGDVEIFGCPAPAPKSRSLLCYLPEKFTPSPNLTGEEFLRLSQSFYQKPYHHNDAQHLAEALGFPVDYLRRFIGKYSKGMAQKLGLIRLFLSKAPLLMLDEPMSGLDPAARVQFKEQLRAYHRLGNTIFFSSHILADIDEICDHMAIIHDASVIFSGTPEAFHRQHPNNTLEQAFLETIGMREQNGTAIAKAS